MDVAQAAALACALLGRPPGCRTPTGWSRPVAALFLDRARAYDLDPGLLLAVCAHETGLNHATVGAAGEIGICQILPGGSAARGLPVAKLRNLWVNVTLAARHLAKLRRFCGNPLAIRNWVGCYSGAGVKGGRCFATRYGREVENELERANGGI